MVDKSFLAFLDEDNQKRSGYFEILEETANYIKFKTTGGAEITIPYSRLLKIKKVENGN